MARSPGHPTATTAVAGTACSASSTLWHTPALAVARAATSGQQREGVLLRAVRAGMGLVLPLIERSIGTERAKGAAALTGAGTPAHFNRINEIRASAQLF